MFTDQNKLTQGQRILLLDAVYCPMSLFPLPREVYVMSSVTIFKTLTHAPLINSIVTQIFNTAQLEFAFRLMI